MVEKFNYFAGLDNFVVNYAPSYYSTMNTLNQIRLLTNRLLIQTFRLEDAANLYQFVKANEEYLYDTGPFTLRSNTSLEASQAFLGRLEQDRLMGKWIWNAIFDKTRNVYLGHIAITYLDLSVRRCELAYFITANETGKGFATEAVEAMVDYCFGGLKMRKIRLRIMRGNQASLRVAAKLGFEECGFFKKDFQNYHGKLVDVFYLELHR